MGQHGADAFLVFGFELVNGFDEWQFAHGSAPHSIYRVVSLANIAAMFRPGGANRRGFAPRRKTDLSAS